MDKDTMLYLFESEQPTGYLTLQKLEMSDENFLKLLSIKPSDLNTIFARVVSYIKDDESQKTKKELANDILEILERSPSARQFIGLGVQSEYKILKGFPVRKGDPYESMPEPGVELVLKPSELYIGWTTDGSKAREDAVKFDASKGDPIGGLLVEVHVDVTKLLFDVNAVIRTVKAKYNLIEQYNNQASPGKALSKGNTKFLASEAPLYTGKWEIVTTNKVVNSRVVDKWTWDTTSGEHKIKWMADNQKTPDTPPDENDQPSNAEVKPPIENKELHQQPSSLPSSTRQSSPEQKLQERIMRLFESADEMQKQDDLPVYEEIMDEEVWQGIKNFFARTLGTMRGKKIKYLQTLQQFYETEKEVYNIAKEFATLVDKDQKRINYANEKIQKADSKIEEIKSVLEDIKSGINIDEIPNMETNPEEKVPYETKDQTPAEKQADIAHADIKSLKTGNKSTIDKTNIVDNPPLPFSKRGK